MCVLLKPNSWLYYSAFYLSCLYQLLEGVYPLHDAAASGNHWKLACGKCSLCNSFLKASHSAFEEERPVCFLPRMSWCSQLTSLWAAAESGWPSPAFPSPPLSLCQCVCRCAAAQIRDLIFLELGLFVVIALQWGLPLVLVHWCSCRIAGSDMRGDRSMWLRNMREGRGSSFWQLLAQIGCHFGNWFILKAVSKSLTCCD